MQTNGQREKATFGAGCFWGVEESFRLIPGVVDAVAGYEGGNRDNPSYEDVCTDRTGHAEVVEVTFDPSVVSYGRLLAHFFEMHDPTQLNRQGPNVGRQYRSVIFAHDEAQALTARAALEELQASGRFRRAVVTAVEPASKFWRAEDYHQQYLSKRGASHWALPETSFPRPF